MSSRHRIRNGTTLAQLQDHYGLGERAAAYCAEHGLITLGRIRKAIWRGELQDEAVIEKDLLALLKHLRTAPRPGPPPAPRGTLIDAPLYAPERLLLNTGLDLNYPIYKPLRMPLSVRVQLLNDTAANIRIAYAYLSPATRKVLDGRLDAYNNGTAWAALVNDAPMKALTTVKDAEPETMREIHFWREEIMALKDLRKYWR